MLKHTLNQHAVLGGSCAGGEGVAILEGNPRRGGLGGGLRGTLAAATAADPSKKPLKLAFDLGATAPRSNDLFTEKPGGGLRPAQTPP